MPTSSSIKGRLKQPRVPFALISLPLIVIGIIVALPERILNSLPSLAALALFPIILLGSWLILIGIIWLLVLAAQKLSKLLAHKPLAYHATRTDRLWAYVTMLVLAGCLFASYSLQPRQAFINNILLITASISIIFFVIGKR